MNGIKMKLSGFQDDIEPILVFLEEKFNVVRASKYKESDLPGEVHIYIVLMEKVGR